MRKPPARQHFALLLLLALSNLYLPFHIYSYHCTTTRNLNTQLQTTLLSLRSSSLPTPLAHISEVHSGHKHLRRLSTALRRHRQCTFHNLRQIRRRHLEFLLVSSTLDGVLLYFIAIIPPRERVALEIGGNSLATAPLALFHGFRVVALSETWRSYDGARALYARHAHIMRQMPTASGMAVEAGRVEGRLGNLTREAGVGRVDVLVNFAGGGEDLGMLGEIRALGARLVVMRYADWLGEERLMVKGGNGGVIAMVESMKRVGYRLVWCLSTQATGIFVRNDVECGLRTVSAKKCLSERNTGVEWRRDMEVLWDETRQKGWRRFT